jgi:hypothetical protein
MTFQNLQKDTDCNCIDGAVIDTTNEYVRKLRKTALEEIDFKTHWERGIKGDSEECDSICNYKGISINQFRDEFVKQILTKYQTTFKINPKKGGYCLKFKLKPDAGKVKFAPEDDDKSHYNFFKSDSFDLNNLDIIETINFGKNETV